MSVLDSSIYLKYEALLKEIYAIPLNSTTLHFTHGAHADVLRNVIDYSWVSNKDEQERASFEDIFIYGQSLGEASTYLSEALHSAISNLQISPSIKKDLERVYCSLPASNVSDLCEAIEESCRILQINWQALI